MTEQLPPSPEQDPTQEALSAMRRIMATVDIHPEAIESDYGKSIPETRDLVARTTRPVSDEAGKTQRSVIYAIPRTNHEYTAYFTYDQTGNEESARVTFSSGPGQPEIEELSQDHARVLNRAATILELTIE